MVDRTTTTNIDVRRLADRVTNRYLATLDPYAPHGHNVETRLRHPVKVVTRRILYGYGGGNGNGNGGGAIGGNDSVDDDDGDLEARFNDMDDEEHQIDGKTAERRLTRRSRARMEAFLASCSIAMREEGADNGGDDDDHGDHENHVVAKGGGVGSSITGGMKHISLNLLGGGGSGGGNKVKKGTAAVSPLPPVRERGSGGGAGGGAAAGAVVVAGTGAPVLKSYRQMDGADLRLRLELYFRTLRRIRALMDTEAQDATTNPKNTPTDIECVLHLEPKKSIRARVNLLIRTYLRTVDCIHDVHRTLTALVLRETLSCLAVETWCAELRSVVHRLVSEYEHKVSFASLAFLGSPDAGAEAHLAPLLVKYYEYLQCERVRLVAECELERMLRTVLDGEMRHFFKNATFHSVGHLLDVCQVRRTWLDNIALPPPWKEGTFGLLLGSVGGQNDEATSVDLAIDRYCSDPTTVRQALRDLRREIITVNGRAMPPAHSFAELAESLGNVLRSHSVAALLLQHGSASGRPEMPKKKASLKFKDAKARRKLRRKRSNYTSDFGLETEEHDESDDPVGEDLFGFDGGESTDASNNSRQVDLGIVDLLTRRLLIAASRTGSGGDAYYVVRDLFGGDEVEVVPHHSKHKNINQGTIEIIVKLSSVTIKSHAKFDIFPKPIVNEADALIQFHTTTTETICLLQQVKRRVDGGLGNAVGGGGVGSDGDDADAAHLSSVLVLKEKKTNTTGWRTLAIRPAYYERVQSPYAAPS